MPRQLSRITSTLSREKLTIAVGSRASACSQPPTARRAGQMNANGYGPTASTPCRCLHWSCIVKPWLASGEVCLPRISFPARIGNSRCASIISAAWSCCRKSGPGPAVGMTERVSAAGTQGSLSLGNSNLACYVIGSPSCSGRTGCADSVLTWQPNSSEIVTIPPVSWRSSRRPKWRLMRKQDRIMTKVLTPDQVAKYHGDGLLFPLPALSREEVAHFRSSHDELDRQLGGRPTAQQKGDCHLYFKWICDLATRPAVLDAVEDIIGPDILIHSSTIFTKYAQDDMFVSWHRDSHYWGLSEPRLVSAWIALTDSTIDNGCLRVLTGTHTRAFEHLEA